MAPSVPHPPPERKDVSGFALIPHFVEPAFQIYYQNHPIGSVLGIDKRGFGEVVEKTTESTERHGKIFSIHRRTQNFTEINEIFIEISFSVLFRVFCGLYSSALMNNDDFE